MQTLQIWGRTDIKTTEKRGIRTENSSVECRVLEVIDFF